MEQYLLAKQLAKPKEKIPIIVSWRCVCSCVWVVWFFWGWGVLFWFFLWVFVFMLPTLPFFPNLTFSLRVAICIWVRRKRN